MPAAPLLERPPHRACPTCRVPSTLTKSSCLCKPCRRSPCRPMPSIVAGKRHLQRGSRRPLRCRSRRTASQLTSPWRVFLFLRASGSSCLCYKNPRSQQHDQATRRSFLQRLAELGHGLLEDAAAGFLRPSATSESEQATARGVFGRQKDERETCYCSSSGFLRYSMLFFVFTLSPAQRLSGIGRHARDSGGTLQKKRAVLKEEQMQKA